MNNNQIFRALKKSEKDLKDFIRYFRKDFIPQANENWRAQIKFNKRTTRQLAGLRASLFCFGVSRLISMYDEYKMLKKVKDVEHKILEMSAKQSEPDDDEQKKDLEDLINEIEEHETDI